MVKRPNFTDIPFNKKTRKKFLANLKSFKKKMAKTDPDSRQTIEIGDMFFEMMCDMMGHYDAHVTFSESGESVIDQHGFMEGAGQNSEFVWHISRTQMFSSFVQSLTPDTLNPLLQRGPLCN